MAYRIFFEIENAPLELNQIDPKWLKDALDKSGIRWKVIVISACYSGSFIPALQDDNTLIITASAADRTSFGCENEADYTYFGRAFLIKQCVIKIQYVQLLNKQNKP